MTRTFLLILICGIITSCYKPTVDPTLPNCKLKEIIMDTTKIELTYDANNKLIREDWSSTPNNNSMGYRVYNYQPGKITETYYNPSGSVELTEQYEINSDNNVTRYTRYDPDFTTPPAGYYDTTLYTYNAQGYLISDKTNNWINSGSQTYLNDASGHNYTYPASNQRQVTSIDYSYNDSTSYIEEYYTNLSFNPNSFQYLPYYYGKSDYQLIKTSGNFTFYYTVDSNKNIIKTQSQLNTNPIQTSQVFNYSCP